jgi:hypothetical protein
VGRYSTVCFMRTIELFNCQLYKNNGSVIVFYRDIIFRSYTIAVPNLGNFLDRAYWLHCLSLSLSLSLYIMKPLLLNRNITIEEIQNINTQLFLWKPLFIFMNQIKL